MLRFGEKVIELVCITKNPEFFRKQIELVQREKRDVGQFLGLGELETITKNQLLALSNNKREIVFFKIN